MSKKTVFGKDKDLLNNQAENLKKVYQLKTWAVAQQFSLEFFIPELVKQLRLLKNEVNEIKSIIYDSSELFTRKINTRCRDDDRSFDKTSNYNIRFFNSKAIRDIAEQLKNQRQLQDEQTNQIRNALSIKLGSEKTFKEFKRKIKKGDFISTLEDTCLNFTRIQVLNNPDLSQYFKENIIESIQNEFSGSQDDLKAYIGNLVKNAGTFCRYNVAEQNKGTEKSDVFPMFIVILPTLEGDFRSNLEEIFRSKVDAVQDLHIIEGKKENEIILFKVRYGFPLRYLEELKYLKEAFDSRTKQGTDEKALFELYLEDPVPQLPPLYLPPPPPKDFEYRLGYVIVGKIIGEIEYITNKRTGRRSFDILVRDEHNVLINQITLGESLLEAGEKISEKQFLLLKEKVSARLKSGEFVHKDDQAKLEREFAQEVKSFGSHDPQFPAFQKAYNNRSAVLKFN